MILYHGTSEEHLDAILAHGLKPRGQENKNSNWDHTVKSRKGHVYLTSSYAFYFSHCAAKAEGGKGVVLEIELTDEDTAKLYPDEDFIAQAQEHNDKVRGESRGNLLARTRRVKLEDFKNSWPLSLQHMGNVSFKGVVPVSRIKRYAIIDTSARMDLVMGYGDNCVSIVAFSVMKATYQGFLGWLFGDNRHLPLGMGVNLAQFVEAGGPFAEHAKRIQEQSADRHGIEVVKVRS